MSKESPLLTQPQRNLTASCPIWTCEVVLSHVWWTVVSTPGSPRARPVSPLPTLGTDYSLTKLPLPEDTSSADSKKRKIKEKNAYQEIDDFWNDFISCQSRVSQTAGNSEQIWTKEKPTNSHHKFHKWLKNDSYLISSKIATCCIKKENFQTYVAVQFLAPRRKEEKSIPYTGNQRFLTTLSSHFPPSFQNQSLKRDFKKEIQK